jgi:hypothetical protein
VDYFAVVIPNGSVYLATQIRPIEMEDKINEQITALQREEQREFELMRRHERTGRPLGEDGFIEGLERLVQRTLRPQKPGPKEKNLTVN